MGVRWDYEAGLAAESEVYELLRGLVRVLKPNRVLETGTAQGCGAKVLANALVANNHGELVTVDVVDVGGEWPRTTVVCGESLAYVQRDAEFDLAFVDCGAAHYRVSVAEVLLNAGAAVVLHDTEFWPEMLGMLPVPALAVGSPRGFALWTSVRHGARAEITGSIS